MVESEDIMRILVNGEMKELEAIGVNGIEWTEELIGQYNTGEFSWNNEKEVYETDEESFEWWEDIVDKLNRVNELEADLTDEEHEIYWKEACGDCCLEDETNQRLAWLEEHFSEQD